MNNGLTILKDGTKIWYKDDQIHCEDGPAIILPDGTKYWWVSGMVHREDGPAVERPDGRTEYYLFDSGRFRGGKG